MGRPGSPLLFPRNPFLRIYFNLCAWAGSKAPQFYSELFLFSYKKNLEPGCPGALAPLWPGPGFFPWRGLCWLGEKRRKREGAEGTCWSEALRFLESGGLGLGPQLPSSPTIKPESKSLCIVSAETLDPRTDRLGSFCSEPSRWPLVP